MKKMTYEEWLDENIDILKEDYEHIEQANFVMFCLNKFNTYENEKN